MRRLFLLTPILGAARFKVICFCCRGTRYQVMITTSIGYTSTINNVWNTRQIQHRYIDYYIPVELDIHTTRQVILVRLVCVPLALCSRLLVGTMLGCGLFLIPSALFLIIYSSLPGVNTCLSCLLRSNRRYAWIYCAVIRDSSSVAV